MAEKLSAKARVKLGALEEARRKWDHVHSLVEKLVSASHRHQQSRSKTSGGSQEVQNLKIQLSRASYDMVRMLTDRGLAVLGEDAGQIAALIRQGGPIERRFRRMRELVGMMSMAIEQAEKVTRRGEKR